jgi:hypothetical protein
MGDEEVKKYRVDCATEETKAKRCDENCAWY